MPASQEADPVQKPPMPADGLAQLVEGRTRDPKTGGSNPAYVRSTRKIPESFSESKMLC